LAKHFRTTYGVGHADDMSGLVVEAAMRAMLGSHDLDRR